jgi:hypothetical protein
MSGTGHRKRAARLTILAAGAPSAASRAARLSLFMFVLLVLGLPLLFGTTAKIFNDGDTGWHLAAGAWILEHGRVPSVDPFSFTMPGRPWTAHEWLADVILAGAFRAAGYAGVAALVTAALTMLHLIIFRRANLAVGHAATFFIFVGLVLVLAPFTVARPHLLVWPLMALWTSLLLRAADERKPPPPWLPLLMILWVNLHGSFPLALVIFAAFGLDALLAGGANMKRWIATGVACAAATLVNANGLAALSFPFTVARMKTLHLITEWGPSSFADTPFFFIVVAIACGALVRARARFAPARLLLLLFLLVMALTQMRHQTWLVIAAAIILPGCVAARTGGELPPKRSPGLATALALPALIALLLPIRPHNGPSYPRALLGAVPLAVRAQPLFNEYSFGGPLILAGVRPYIDGRADMYGDDFFTDYARINSGDIARFDAAVKRYGIRWTMLQHSNRRLIKALDASPRWRRLAADEVGVVHVRVGPQ